MNKGLTKADSTCLKGIGILIMLFHHLFCQADRFEEYEIIFSPFTQESVVNVALYFKICVSVFAFITGYGLLKSVKKIEISKKHVAKWTLNRYIKTMSGFWFIYVISFIATMLINKLPARRYMVIARPIRGIVYAIIDFLGLANLFSTPTLNATWWYMSAATVFIVLIPVIYALSKKVGYATIMLIVIAIPRILQIGYTSGVSAYTFLPAVIMGMIFAEYNCFEKISSIGPKNKALSYITKFVLFGAIVVFAIALNKEYNYRKAWELNLGILPVAFICFCRYSIIRIPVIKQITEFLGKHSMTIFLTHTFLREMYLKDQIYGFKNFLLIYAVLLVLSVALALVIDIVKSLTRYDKVVDKITNKINLILF